MKQIVAFLLIPLLAACSLTQPRDVGKANMLALHPMVEAQEVKQKRGTITIQLPEAPTVLDTYRIAVTLPDGRDDYIAGARWNDFLTSMVQQGLRDNFAQSHVFMHTYLDTDTISGKYILYTDIRSFSAAYETANAAPTVIVKLGFTLKNAATNRVVKQFSESASIDAEANSLSAIHAAFDKAFNEVSAEAVQKISAVAK